MFFFFQFPSIKDTLWAFTWKIICHCLVKIFSAFILDPRLFMISGVKRARFGIKNVGQPETVKITETVRMSSVLPTVLCWLGPACIGNFQPGQPGSRHYNTADVNKQLVHAGEKQLCGCITSFSTFLWRPLHDYDVKLPNMAFYGVHKDGIFLSVLVGRGF